MARRCSSRNGFANFECLIVLMFLGLVFSILILGIKYGESVSGSKLMGFAWGILAEFVFWATFAACCTFSAALVRLRSTQLRFADAFVYSAANGIVIVWFAGVLAALLVGGYKFLSWLGS